MKLMINMKIALLIALLTVKPAFGMTNVQDVLLNISTFGI